MAPPLRDEIIVDRATQNSARNRYDTLKKEADELNIQSRQLEEAHRNMTTMRTRLDLFNPIKHGPGQIYPCRYVT